MEWSSIQGYVDKDQEPVFRRLIAKLPDDAIIVEIGSWKGRSAIMMGQLIRDLKKDAHIICVDHFRGRTKRSNVLPEFEKNVIAADMRGLISFIVNDSTEAAKEFVHPIDMWFFDADHTPEGTVENFKVWRPLFNDKCIVVFHNYDWEKPEFNVKAAVNSLKGELPGLYAEKRMAICEMGY